MPELFFCDIIYSENLVAAVVAVSEGEIPLGYTADLGHKGNQRLIGLAVHRRGGNGYLQLSAVKADNTVFGGLGLDINGKVQVVVSCCREKWHILLFFLLFFRRGLNHHGRFV